MAAPQQIQNAKHTAISIYIYATDEVGPAATSSHVSTVKNLLDGLETLADLLFKLKTKTGMNVVPFYQGRKSDGPIFRTCTMKHVALSRAKTIANYIGACTWLDQRNEAEHGGVARLG